MKRSIGVGLVLALFAESIAWSQELTPRIELPKVYQSSLTDPKETERWEFMDDKWSLDTIEGISVLRLHDSASSLAPKFRSPTHLAILRDLQVNEFQLDVKVRSTREDYNHRDVCFYFGYQSPTEYYYAHLAKKTDDRANQIFIVNNADRIKISTKTTDGTSWDDKWHQVRVTRDEENEIRVYFDDMTTPIMTANDGSLKGGRIGVGSFDDTADFSEITLRGNRVDQGK